MTDRPDEPTLDDVLDAELPRYADALKRLGAGGRAQTVFVVTKYREFVSVHRTRAGAEAARSAFIAADMAEHGNSIFESVREAADEPPDTQVIEVEIDD